MTDQPNMTTCRYCGAPAQVEVTISRTRNGPPERYATCHAHRPRLEVGALHGVLSGTRRACGGPGLFLRYLAGL